MPLGVAVWSIGNHARRNLLPALRKAPSTQIVGVLSRDRAAAQTVAREYDAHAFDTPGEMLRDSRVEAVVLAGPNALHFQQAIATLHSGKHAFVEKTLACSELEVRALATAAKSGAVVIAECFMFEHHPQFLALRELLRSQELGPLRSLTCRFGFPHLEPTDIRYSRELAGGALNDTGRIACRPYSDWWEVFRRAWMARLSRGMAGRWILTAGPCLVFPVAFRRWQTGALADPT